MRLDISALSYSAHQGKGAALWKAQQGQKPKSFWLHTMQWACLPPASSLHLFWNTPSGSQQVPEHWNTTSFQQHFHLKFESNKSCKIPPSCRAGPHLPVNSHIHAIQWGNKPLPSKVRGSGSYFIYQRYSRKAYVKAVEELDSVQLRGTLQCLRQELSPGCVKQMIQQHQIPRSAHVTQHMPSLPTTTTGTFHNPKEQRAPHRTAARAQPKCPVTGQPFGFTRLQSSPAPKHPCLPSHSTQSLCFPLWPSCTSAWVKSHLRRTRQTQHTAGALVRLSCFTAVNNSQLEGDPPDRQVWPPLPGTPPETCHLY